MDNKRTGAGVPILSLIQTLLLFLCVIYPLLKMTTSGAYMASHHQEIGLLAIIPLGILIVINFLIHYRKYEEYVLRWGNENFKARFVKGCLVIVFLMSPLLLLWWMQYQPWF